MRFIRAHITIMICLLSIAPMGTVLASGDEGGSAPATNNEQQLQILGIMPASTTTPQAGQSPEQTADQQETTTPAPSEALPTITTPATPAPLPEGHSPKEATAAAEPAVKNTRETATTKPTAEQMHRMEQVHGMAPGAMEKMMRAMEAAHKGVVKHMAEGKAEEHHTAATENPHHGGLHWSYQGAGAPYYWGDLKEAFATCKSGKQQSPIDISSAVITSLPEIDIHYDDTALDVINNGHAIQVNYQAGSYITVAGKRYNLLQFHFHSPSEHTVGGKRYDMVAHLVHKADDGQLAVIAIMMKQGHSNPLIEQLWTQLSKSGKTSSASDMTVNAQALLPHDKTYFNYSGSLTTPPCSEGVNWMVFAAPVEVSADQIARFREFVPYDARPVQAINGRTIRLSN